MNQSVVITFLCKPVNLSQVTRFGAPEHCCIKARFSRGNSRQRCWVLVQGQVPGLDVSVSLGTSRRLCRPQSGAGGNAPAVCTLSWVEKTPSCSPASALRCGGLRMGVSTPSAAGVASLEGASPGTARRALPLQKEPGQIQPSLRGSAQTHLTS